MSKNSRLVYSTDAGRIKENDDSGNTPPDSDGIVRIHRDTKGRKGNGVSVIKGLGLTAPELKKLAKTLKQKMGVGGSVKEFTIEIQSDDREKLQTLLSTIGYTTKIAGS